MLNEQLIVKTRPIAKAENIVYCYNYRVTVLGDCLFRLEESKSGKFRDCATLSVWYRDMPKQDFTVENLGEKTVIATKKCKLVLCKNRKDCRIQLVQSGDKLLRIDNRGNLKGTFRTLDNCDGDLFVYEWVGPERVYKNERITLENGVCSRTGVAVYDDSKSLSLGDDGKAKEEMANGTDEYIFAFGNDYKGAVKALYDITGYPPVVPKFALGNWWSRYHAYSDREYLSQLNLFEERNVPFTVAVLDMDWHYSDDVDERFSISKQGLNEAKYGGSRGWTGYTWNEDLFPNPKGFLAKLQDKNYAVTLNLHPADGVRWWEKSYQEIANACGVDAQSKEVVAFDLTSDDFTNAYFSILHTPLEKEGVDFWWIDWQQGTQSKTKGLDPLWLLNHYHYLDNAKNGNEPLILSRYAGVGSHRYPLGFSGDTYISWDTLEYLSYFTATASNIGYSWWSHDIGGHQEGVKDDELFVRFVQQGVFSPINRLHCMNFDVVSKEPAFYENGTGLIVEKWLRFRHQMIAYMHSASIRNYKEGLPLMQPLYYSWDCEAAYKYRNEYIFGEDLLVIPVTKKRGNKQYAAVKAWFPQGTWTDIFTGEQICAPENGLEKTLYRDLENMPVFAKNGSVLTLLNAKGNSFDLVQGCDLFVYSGNGETTFYEGENGKTFATVYTMQYTENNGVYEQVVHIKGSGDFAPIARKMRVKFPNLRQGDISVLENGEPIKAEDYEANYPCVIFSFDPMKTYEIKVLGRAYTQLEREIEFARELLCKKQGKNVEKQETYLLLKEAKCLEEFYSIIEKLER